LRGRLEENSSGKYFSGRGNVTRAFGKNDSGPFAKKLKRPNYVEEEVIGGKPSVEGIRW